MTYLFLKKKEYSDIVIVLALQIILIILIFIYTKYNLYCLMEVETIKIEALDKLVQEVETMKKPASSHKETKILTKEEEYERD